MWVSMACYTVLPRQRQPGYKVEVLGDDGARHTILGFTTETEAKAWIAFDQVRERTWQPVSMAADDG